MSDLNQTISTDYVVSSVRGLLADDQMIALGAAIVDAVATQQNEFSTAVNNQLLDLRALVEAAAAEANVLNQAELDQVNSLIVNLLSSMDIQSMVASLGVRIGTKTYTLSSIVAALALAAREVQTDMILAADGKSYTGARMTLTDGRQAMFAATSTEVDTGVVGEKRLRFVFSSLDFAGVAAMFEMSFLRRQLQSLTLGAIQIPVNRVFDESRTNIVLDLTGQLVEVAAPTPTPAPAPAPAEEPAPVEPTAPVQDPAATDPSGVPSDAGNSAP